MAEAITMTTRYRQNRDAILQSVYLEPNLLPFSETFDKTQIETLLNRSGCTQLRCYYGMDEALQVHLLLVGVNADNEDILPPAPLSEEEESEDDYVLERANRCPDFCPPDSELNS